MIQNLLNKIKKWQNRRKFLVVIAWSLILLGPILTGLTVSILQGEFGSKLSNILRLILLVDGIYLLVVISIVGYAVMKMFAARRAKSAGSRLHMRLSRVFAIVALIPTVLVAVFAVVTLSIGRRAHQQHRRQIHTGLNHRLDCGQHGIQQRLLLEQVVVGVGGQP